LKILRRFGDFGREEHSLDPGQVWMLASSTQANERQYNGHYSPHQRDRLAIKGDHRGSLRRDLYSFPPFAYIPCTSRADSRPMTTPATGHAPNEMPTAWTLAATLAEV
jgi:hypothetical protein